MVKTRVVKKFKHGYSNRGVTYLMQEIDTMANRTVYYLKDEVGGRVRRTYARSTNLEKVMDEFKNLERSFGGG